MKINKKPETLGAVYIYIYINIVTKGGICRLDHKLAIF